MKAKVIVGASHLPVEAIVWISAYMVSFLNLRFLSNWHSTPTDKFLLSQFFGVIGIISNFFEPQLKKRKNILLLDAVTDSPMMFCHFFFGSYILFFNSIIGILRNLVYALFPKHRNSNLIIVLFFGLLMLNTWLNYNRWWDVFALITGSCALATRTRASDLDFRFWLIITSFSALMHQLIIQNPIAIIKSIHGLSSSLAGFHHFYHSSKDNLPSLLSGGFF